MTRVLLVTAALVAAVAVWIAVSLPPRAVALDRPWNDGTVPGILHIHSRTSDGRSGADEIASAAARAGLAFIVLTDHGNATREPEPPAYRSGVLCIDAVEISTTGGHYVALNLGRAPYPLGGEPRDVVDDVRRLGGFGIAAHPDSPKSELAWRDWDAPIDGLEILNPDTSWRVHVLTPGWRSKLRLIPALGAYPFRAAETIGSLLTDSPEARARWTTLNASRRIVGTAGIDAHAKLELRDVEPGDNRFSLPVPGYEPSFRALSVHVTPSAPLSGDAALDARRVLDGIVAGRLYTAVDAWATPPAFEFTATNAAGTAAAGDELAPSGQTSLRVRHNGPDGYRTTIWRGSEPLERDRRDRDFAIGAAAAGVYRVEVRDPRYPDGPPWITSNPIYLRRTPAAVRRPALPPATVRSPLFDGRSTAGWTTESDPTSVSAVEVVPVVTGPDLRVRFGLSGGSDVGQFAGVAVAIPAGVASFDRVAFTIHAEEPMRVSIQVRAAVPGVAPERWQRSIYVDATERERSVVFSEMTPVGRTHTASVPAADVRDLMFIVDTTNTAPGHSGRLWIRNVRLER